MTRFALLTALASLILTSACIPSRQPATAPAPAPQPAQVGPLDQHERPIMATVTVTGRERCPSTHEGYGFAGSQREGDMATCFYR